MRSLIGGNLSKYQEPLNIAMQNAVDKKILPPGSTTMNHSVMIRSIPPCGRQKWHKDVQYKVMYSRGRYVSLFVAIMDDTKLHIKYPRRYNCSSLLVLNKGGYMVFGGRVCHAGASYKDEHFRLFAYIGVGVPGRPDLVQRRFPNCTAFEEENTSSDEYAGGEYSDPDPESESSGSKK